MWFKEAPYRSRVAIEPRKVLAEFGTNVSEETEVRVWDSSAEMRYFVLPERPAGTDGMSEEELANLVTRDSMIGVTKLSAN
jgi:nitrile hydratase